MKFVTTQQVADTVTLMQLLKTNDALVVQVIIFVMFSAAMVVGNGIVAKNVRLERQ